MPLSKGPSLITHVLHKKLITFFLARDSNLGHRVTSPLTNHKAHSLAISSYSLILIRNQQVSKRLKFSRGSACQLPEN